MVPTRPHRLGRPQTQNGDGEGEVALAITDAILRRLGATPEQMDEQRLRIRSELFPRA